MDAQKDAWDRIYSNQSRQWRGASDLSWTGIAPGMSVLDAGCGNGKTSRALIDLGARVTGIDFSEPAVRSCRERMGAEAEFAVADVRDLPFSDSSFGAVAAFHVLEHVPAQDIYKAASEILRVARPGGRICVRSFAEGDMRARGKEDVRNGILYRYFSEDEMRALFEKTQEISVRKVAERTRFGTERSRLECVFVKY